MDNRLVYPAEKLFVPPVSGMVSISLAELDSLRIAASNAVNTAQVLEAQQRLVKVVIEENYSYHTPDKVVNGADNWGNAQYAYIDRKREGKRIVSIEVLNIGDIMSDLVQKATNDVKGAWETEVEGLRSSNKTLEATLESRAKGDKYTRDSLSEVKAELRERKEKSYDLQAKLSKSEQEVIKLENREKYFWKPMQNKYTKLIDSFNKLNTRKTLWGWLQNKIAEEGEVKNG